MIGLFNDCFPPIMDGVSVATSNYAYWLNRKGKDVCVITPTASSFATSKDEEAYPIYRYMSMPIPMRKPYRLGFPRIDWPFHKQIDDIPFELVHAHCPFSSGNIAMRIAKARRVPVVATFHSKYRADFEHIIPNKFIIDRLIQQIVRFYEQADEVWIPQASVEETLREYGYKGKVEVMDNGNDFAGTYSEPDREKARLALGVMPDERLFIFVGQHIWEKNAPIHRIAERVAFPHAFRGDGLCGGGTEKDGVPLGTGTESDLYGLHHPARPLTRLLPGFGFVPVSFALRQCPVGGARGGGFAYPFVIDSRFHGFGHCKRQGEWFPFRRCGGGVCRCHPPHLR